MRWMLSHRADPKAARIADRHYNRQTPGSPQFVPPGRCLVLVTPQYDALWVTSWPFAEYTKHEWAGAWVNSLFRNESEHLSSELIREAFAVTCWYWETMPAAGMVTFIDPSVVPGYFRRTDEGRVLEWGYSYRQAGFEHCGWTKGGLWAMQKSFAQAPIPRPAPLFDELQEAA